VVNDATLAALGCSEGRGTEIVFTLGTGFGIAPVVDGSIERIRDVGAEVFVDGRTYDQVLGENARSVDEDQWSGLLHVAVSNFEAYVEYNWALESGLYNIDMTPLHEIQRATGIAWPDLLDVRMPGTVMGAVSREAGDAAGLRPGTPLVVGGADHVLSAYGAGLINQGDCLVKLGGSGDILAVSDEVFLDARLYLDRHPMPGKWLPNGCMATSGSLLRWEQSIFNSVALEELDEAAAAAQPGALLSLPYFLGEKTPLHDPDLRGVIVGLHLGSTRGDIHRSFLEAIAYGFKAHFDVFERGGLAIGTTRVTNGGSKSRLWREILADVLNRDLISLVEYPGASYGAAVIAGVGTGLIGDWSYVTGALEVAETISPRAEHVALFEERYQEFLQLSDVTTPTTHVLARSSS